MRKDATQHIILMKDGKQLGRIDYYWFTKKSIRVIWAETHDPDAWKYIWREFKKLPWVQFIYHREKLCTKECEKGKCWKAHWRLSYA